MYRDNQEAMFIHVPKNAGVSIRSLLIKYGFKNYDALDKQFRTIRHPALANHMPIYMLQSFPYMPVYINKSFMVVRNPWDRMVSLYNHRMRKLYTYYEGKPRNNSKDIAVAKQGFVPWLLTTPSLGDKVLTRMPQINWGKDQDGNYVIKDVLRYEKLSDHWSKLSNIYAWPVDVLLHINSSNTTDYRSVYNQEAIDHVAKYFAEDIELYSYDF